MRECQKGGISTEDPKEEVSGNLIFLGLGGVLETSFGSSMLHEVYILPNLFIFHSKGCMVVFYALRGCLEKFWG